MATNFKLRCCVLWLLAGFCFSQEPEAPAPSSNVRVAYNGPNGHYLVEDRSIDGTSLIGNFGYQTLDGQNVGVAYSSEGAGFVISAPDTTSTVDHVSFSNRNQPAIASTSAPVAASRRGRVRPSSIPAVIDQATAIDDMITQLDSRPASTRRRRPRKQRPRQRQREQIR